MENVSSSGKIVGALLLGVAIGGAMGILFAPDKGSRTRKRIFDKSDDIADVLTEKFDEFIEAAQKEYVKVKDKSKEKVNEYANGKAKAL